MARTIRSLAYTARTGGRWMDAQPTRAVAQRDALAEWDEDDDAADPPERR